jgi:hypothetical protein
MEHASDDTRAKKLGDRGNTAKVTSLQQYDYQNGL